MKKVLNKILIVIFVSLIIFTSISVVKDICNRFTSRMENTGQTLFFWQAFNL